MNRIINNKKTNHKSKNFKDVVIYSLLDYNT